jgi:hypothetical protein
MLEVMTEHSAHKSVDIVAFEHVWPPLTAGAVKYAVVREYPSHLPNVLEVVLQCLHDSTVVVGPVQAFPLVAAAVKKEVVLWDPLQVPIEVDVVLQSAHISAFVAGPQEAPLNPGWVEK